MRGRSHKKNVVVLTPAERTSVQSLIDRRRLPVRSLRRLEVLLLADQSPGGLALTDAQISLRSNFSIRTIEWIRSTYCTGGVRGLTSWRGKRLLPDEAAFAENAASA